MMNVSYKITLQTFPFVSFVWNADWEVVLREEIPFLLDGLRQHHAQTLLPFESGVLRSKFVNAVDVAEYIEVDQRAVGKTNRRIRIGDESSEDTPWRNTQTYRN